MMMQKSERSREPYQAARTVQWAEADCGHWIEPVTAEATMVPCGKGFVSGKKRAWGEGEGDGVLQDRGLGWLMGIGLGDTYGQADVFELRPLVLGPSHDDIVARGLVVHVDHLLRGDVEVLPWRRGDVLRDTQQPEESILSRLARDLVVRWLGRLGEPCDVGLRGRLRHRSRCDGRCEGCIFIMTGVV